MQLFENVEKDLKNGKINSSIYLFYGEEQYLIQTAVKRIKNIFGECVKGINYILIDETNITELISDIETPSFGYEKKLIVVKDSNLFKKDTKRKTSELTKFKEKLCQYITQNIDIINQSVILIFIEQEAEKQELLQIIDKNGIVAKVDYQKPIALIARIKEICKMYNVTIENSDIQYFIECVGTKLQDIINEIRKLIEYAGNGGKIQKEDIDKLSTKKLESVVFDLTDNLGKRNIKQSLIVLQNLIYEKEPIQKILITLYNHFKKLLFTKIAIKNNKDMIYSLNLKPNQTFLVNKYKTQAKYFNQKELKNIMQALIDLDYNYKNGLIDLQIGLESILCRYCS